MGSEAADKAGEAPEKINYLEEALKDPPPESDDAEEDDAEEGEQAEASGEEGDEEEGEPKRKPIPKPKGGKRPRDRITDAVMARKRRRGEHQSREAQIAAREQQLQQAEHAFKQRHSAFQQAMTSEDYDAALASLGFPKLSEIQRKALEKKGAIPPQDPKVRELEEKLASYERAQQEQLKRYHEQQREEQERQQQSQLMAQLKDAVLDTDYENIDKFAELPGFLPMVMDQINGQDGEEVDLDDAIAYAYEDYRELHARLLDVYGAPDPAGDEQEADETADEEAPPRRKRRRGASSVPVNKTQGARGKKPVEVTGRRATASELEAIIAESKRLHP